MPNRRVIDSVISNYKKEVYVDYMNKDVESLERKMYKFEQFMNEYKLLNDRPSIDALVYIQVLYAKATVEQNNNNGGNDNE